MSYSSLTSRQFVSNNNLQDAVITSVLTLNMGQTIPANDRIVTKLQLLTLVNADSANSYLTVKSNSQLVAKRDITPIGGSDPSTATLTFSEYTSGQFVFDLSVPIPSTDVVITEAIVNGAPTLDCSGGYDSSDTINSGNSLTITAGMVTGIEIGNTPMSCDVNSYVRIDSIIVNGSVKHDGETITIGGTTVTIIIDTTCDNTYSC